MENKPHTFCVTKPSTCTMNYCDENGCQDRKRNLVEVSEGGEVPKEENKPERIFSGTTEEILNELQFTDDAYYHHSQIAPVIEFLREQLKQKDEKLKRTTDYLSGLPEFQEKLKSLLSTTKDNEPEEK